jgi:hypothetical protein
MRNGNPKGRRRVSGAFWGVLLTVCSFGCLERINFLLRRGLGLNMSCKVAGSPSPFRGGIREGRTIGFRSALQNASAARTAFNYLMAGAAVKGTPFLAHERASNTWFYRYAVHGNHPLILCILILCGTSCETGTNIGITGHLSSNKATMQKPVLFSCQKPDPRTVR